MAPAVQAGVGHVGPQAIQVCRSDMFVYSKCCCQQVDLDATSGSSRLPAPLWIALLDDWCEWPYMPRSNQMLCRQLPQFMLVISIIPMYIPSVSTRVTGHYSRIGRCMFCWPPGVTSHYT